MNLVEGMAREILRVAKIRRHYEDIGPAGQFGLLMIDASLEQACVAAGTGDIIAMAKAHEDLKGIKE